MTRTFHVFRNILHVATKGPIHQRHGVCRLETHRPRFLMRSVTLMSLKTRTGCPPPKLQPKLCDKKLPSVLDVRDGLCGSGVSFRRSSSMPR